jgi:hypothetical protein
MKKAKIINLFGAPCAGKSVTRAGLFYLMKHNGYLIEETNEYAKDVVFEKRNDLLKNQNYIFAKQEQKLIRLSEMDYIVTDCPLLLSSYYAKLIPNFSSFFAPFVLDTFNSYDNINFFLKRVGPYVHHGRYQTEEESDQVAIELEEFLKDHNCPYISIDGNLDAPYKIMEIIKNLDNN